MFVAEGSSWSPATHHHWPDAFKAAARTLLLAGSIAGLRPTGRTRSGRGFGGLAAAGSHTPGLGCLPREVLLRVIQLAAHPMSAWLPVGLAARG